MDKARMKKVANILLNVLLYVFLALCILAVLITLLAKRDSDGAAEVFGYQMRVVTSDSMSESEHTDVSEYDIKDIPIRSMVFVKLMPDDPAEVNDWYRSLKVGDVLTFRYVYTTQVTITHRIVSIEEKETGGFIIELAGDNREADNGQLYQRIDTSIPNNTNYVIGKVTGQAYLLGVIMSFLMQPMGIIFVIIIPCAIIILLEILKITKMFVNEKKKREQDEAERKDNEIKELRQKVAELEREKSGQPSPDVESEREETN